MEKKELDQKLTVKALFLSLKEVLLYKNDEHVEEEMIISYHKNLERLEELSEFNLSYFRMEEKDKSRDFIEVKGMGALTSGAEGERPKEIYKRDALLLKVGQICHILEEIINN